MKWWGWVIVCGSLFSAAATSNPTHTDHLSDDHYDLVCGQIWHAGARDDSGSPAREAIRTVCNL